MNVVTQPQGKEDGDQSVKWRTDSHVGWEEERERHSPEGYSFENCPPYPSVHCGTPSLGAKTTWREHAQWKRITNQGWNKNNVERRIPAKIQMRWRRVIVARMRGADCNTMFTAQYTHQMVQQQREEWGRRRCRTRKSRSAQCYRFQFRPSCEPPSANAREVFKSCQNRKSATQWKAVLW